MPKRTPITAADLRNRWRIWQDTHPTEARRIRDHYCRTAVTDTESADRYLTASIASALLLPAATVRALVARQ